MSSTPEGNLSSTALEGSLDELQLEAALQEESLNATLSDTQVQGMLIGATQLKGIITPPTAGMTAHGLGDHDDTNFGTPAEGDLITWDADDAVWTLVPRGDISGGSLSFLDLTDTPDTYAGAEGLYPKVVGGQLVFSTVPAGGGGGGDLNFTYDQPTPSVLWDITHNLGKFPSVSVVDSAGSIVHGEVQHVNPNHLILHFSAGFSGKAYLN